MQKSVKDFGEIEFVRSKRAKRINVRILEEGLKVSLPIGATEKDALEFIEKVYSRILKKQKQIKAKTNEKHFVFNKETELQTLSFNVKLFEAERKNLFFSLKDNLLSIEYPFSIDFEKDEIQRFIWNGINYFLRKEAKRILPRRLESLANKYKFDYSTVKIQASKTRWGSCSQAKNINLSFYLMLLPQDLVDYVILHELCHTKEMNHSVKFWDWMDKVTENQSKALRVELKKHQIPQF